MAHRSSTTLWLIIAVLGMGLLQWLTRSQESNLLPGPERGDIIVQQDVLESEIGGWKQIKFTPAKNAEQLAEGQFWWSSSWHYQKGDLVAIVSFDQANWYDWHELTECYQAIGWELRGRTLRSDATVPSEPTLVEATFEKSYRNESACLLFSEFDEQGRLLTAPGLSVIRPKVDPGATVFEKAQNRVEFDLDSDAHGPQNTLRRKVLQVQVFVPHNRELTQLESSNLMNLHAHCTTSLRREWLRQSKPLASTASELDRRAEQDTIDPAEQHK